MIISKFINLGKSNNNFRSEDQVIEYKDEESLHLKQNNPSLGNITKCKSNKEIKSVKQVQSKENCEKTTDSIIQSEVSGNSKSKNRKRN